MTDLASEFQPTQPRAANEDEFAALSGKAEQCRRLAAGISDRQAADVLRSMASRYEESAERLNRR